MWPFKFFTKRKVEDPTYQIASSTPQTPVAEKEEELPDDWEPKHENWMRVEQCHCGQPAYGYIGNGAYPAAKFRYEVCPRCGHTDKWETFIGRLEYEYSESRYARMCKAHPYAYAEKNDYTRDSRTVRWTPEHCQIKDEEK